MRIAVAALVLIGLVAGVWLLWPDGDDEETPTTEAVASTTTTTSTPGEPATTTVTATTSTTTVSESHVVETVEEAEEILRELWFGWFEGIYNQDEERIREVVATRQMLETATSAFGANFESPPARDGIILDLEILRSDEACLATWGTLDVTGFRGPDATTDSVQVLRHSEGSWRFATSWTSPDDLWEADCEAELLPLP